MSASDAPDETMLLRAQVEHLTQQLRLQVQQARAAQGSVRLEDKDRAKMGTPKPFDGKVTHNVLTWLVSMESYLMGCNTPRERWPIVASTYLEAAGLDWYHSYFLSTNGVMTWEDFKAAIVSRFRPVDSNRLCRAQLMELRMKSSDKGRGILQYVDRFHHLVNQISDITETEKYAYFHQGLTPELKRMLIPFAQVNRVEDVISMVIRYEMLDPDTENNKGWSRGDSSRRFYPKGQSSAPSMWSGQGKSSNPAGTTGAATTTPMELGTMDSKYEDQSLSAEEKDPRQMEQLHAVGNSEMTEEERENHLRRGLCFRCHKPGHLSRNCPLKGRARK